MSRLMLLLLAPTTLAIVRNCRLWLQLLDALRDPFALVCATTKNARRSMRIRYLVIIFVAGLYFAMVRDSPSDAYVTAFICIVAYGLRRIEGQLMAIGSELAKLNAKELGESNVIEGDSGLPIFQGYRVHRVPDKTFVRPPPMQAPSVFSQPEIKASPAAADKPSEAA